MTRKDYRSIAKIFKDNKLYINDSTINDFVILFKKDNSRFNRDKFIEACK